MEQTLEPSTRAANPEDLPAQLCRCFVRLVPNQALEKKMIAYVVHSYDGFGHASLRKVAGSASGAQSYIDSALAATSATDIVWDERRTSCTAMVRWRGEGAGFEWISYTIEAMEMID